MYLSPIARRALLIGGLALIAVIGIIGWTHRSSTPAYSAAAYVPNAAPDYTQPVNAPGTAPVVYSASPFGSSLAPAPAPPVAEPEPESESADRYGIDSRSYASRGYRRTGSA